jgi:histone-binding protein RBBP4
MPQNPFILATKSPSSDVFVFDISRHPSSPKDNSFCPEHRCLGHSKEGYGLCWNHHVAGELLSGSDDCKICLWDLNQSSTTAQALNTWSGHGDVVEDVSWHVHSPHVFGSVGDDRQILLWDTRANSVDPFVQITEAHGADINSIAFNPHHEFLLATGSADQFIKLWDIRNTSDAIHTLNGHDKEVFQIQWAPFDASVLASCGADRRIRVWDLRNVGTLSSSHDESSPSELLFIHGGHSEKISDLSWNTMQDWVIASVSDDNILQIWRMAQNIYAR